MIKQPNLDCKFIYGFLTLLWHHLPLGVGWGQNVGLRDICHILTLLPPGASVFHKHMSSLCIWKKSLPVWLYLNFLNCISVLVEISFVFQTYGECHWALVDSIVLGAHVTKFCGWFDFVYKLIKIVNFYHTSYGKGSLKHESGPGHGLLFYYSLEPRHQGCGSPIVITVSVRLSVCLSVCPSTLCCKAITQKSLNL